MKFIVNILLRKKLMKKIIFIAFLLISFFHNLSGLNAKTKCISGNCFNGSGTKVYSTGSKYVGEFKDGKENGTGTYYFPKSNTVNC